MEHSIENKVAVITGAGGGIGSAIVASLARENVKIALCGGTNLEKLSKISKTIENLGSEYYVLPGDLTDESFLDNCIDEIAHHFGSIDYLINNAGITLNKSFENTSLQDLNHIFNINVNAPFILCRNALKYLKKSESAEIINIASVVAHKGYVNQSAYAASKHALLGLSKSLANELYKENIRVHVLSPGGVYTDMVKIARPDLTGENMIMPDEIADIIMFLLKHRGNAVIDEICVHRIGKAPF